MRQQVIVKTLAAASANNIALSQTPVSGTALTLNGTTVTGGVATLDSQRQVLLTFGSEGSDRTMVISGTNDTGAHISETLAIASGASGTIGTKQSFLTVTSALPLGGGWTAAVTLGTSAFGSTPWIIVDAWQSGQKIGFELELLSGAATASIETTQNSPLPPLPIYVAGFDQTLPVPTAFPLSGLTNVAGSTQGSSGAGDVIAAWRLTVNGTASWRATSLQAGDWH